jgi:hypothetical protein
VYRCFGLLSPKRVLRHVAIGCRLKRWARRRHSRLAISVGGPRPVADPTRLKDLDLDIVSYAPWPFHTPGYQLVLTTNPSLRPLASLRPPVRFL